MNVLDALYIMLGANIGTTITAQIIAFNIDWLAPAILFVGMVMYTFIENKFVKKIGGVILGFGMLFVGIYIIKLAASQLDLSSVMEKFLEKVSNPLLSLLFGLVITAIIQSSSASIGILQTLAASAAVSAAASGTACSITLTSVFYIVLGMNIGAISPVVLASFTGNAATRRTALAGVFAKVFGTLAFILLYLLFDLFSPVSFEEIIIKTNSDISRQIANLHLIFNIVSTVVLFPFARLIAKLCDKVIPVHAGDEETAKKLLYLNPEILMTPAISVMQCKSELARMEKITFDNLERSLQCFFNGDSTDRVFEVEETINYLNHEITGYLISLNSLELSAEDKETVGMMFHVVADIERIGDHAENIAEYSQIKADHHVKFTEEGWNELKDIADKTVKSVRLAAEIYNGRKFEKLQEMSDLEEHIDDLKDQYTENHIARLKKDQCNPRGGVIFTDLVTDLERCSDHAINIAYAINGEKATVEVKKNFVIERISQ
jgi:phosphate:Na+ symporter